MAFFIRFFLVSGILLLLAACNKKKVPAKSPVPSTTTSSPKPKEVKRVYAGAKMEQDVLYYTNQYRQKKGLQPLVLEKAASEQAYLHSHNMAARRAAFGHSGFEKRIATIEDQIGRIGGASENVAFGHDEAKDVVDGWIKSAPHRKNLEGNFNLMGLGYAKDAKGIVYFTQIFLRK